MKSYSCCVNAETSFLGAAVMYGERMLFAVYLRHCGRAVDILQIHVLSAAQPQTEPQNGRISIIIAHRIHDIMNIFTSSHPHR